MKLGLVLFSLCFAFLALAETAPHSFIAYDSNAANQVLITWEAIPGKQYNVMTTTALGQQPWQAVNQAPLLTSNNWVKFQDRGDGPSRFYKVVKLDTDPPEIWRLNPGSNSFSVALQNPLKISLRDETGIDPASMVLTVGTNAPVTLADLRLSYVNGTLTYTPPTNEFHGTYGETVTAALAVSDTLGHRATNTWPFRLELATILAGNVVLITNSGPLTFVSSNDNTYVFSYTGDSSGLTNGHVLVSTDPDNDYKLVVLSITDNPSAHTVSIVTAQALMSDIFRQGSLRFLAEDLDLDGGEGRPASERHSFTYDLSGKTIYDDNGLTVETVSGQFFFDQDYSISAEISLSAPPKVDVDLFSTLGLDLELHATYQGTFSHSEDKLIGGPLRLVRFRGCIPTPFPPICIPFRADLVGAINIGIEGEVTGTATLTAGFQSRWELTYGSRFRNWQWEPYRDTNLPEPVVSPMSWMGTGSGRLRVYLEPKLILYVWAAQIGTGNLKPYLEVEANACVHPGRAGTVLTLYGGVSSTLALELKRWNKDWGEQPSVELFNIRKQIGRPKDFTTAIGGAPSITPVTNMVWIPCGTFNMGSPPDEPARYDSEGPQTRVTISQGFWMGRYEVTEAEYLAVMGNNPSYFTSDMNRPVEQVSWDDAVIYCAALTALEQGAGRLPTNYVYRLPTEAEWEYGCRAGTTTPFHYGIGLRSARANFYGLYEYPPCGLSIYNCYNPSGIYLGRTTSVGNYAPNAWGLYDMHGNVLEWCQDWYSASLPGVSVTDPQGPATGSYRVIRGGSWGWDADYCRSAFRIYDYPSHKDAFIGFRVVLSLAQPGKEAD